VCYSRRTNKDDQKRPGDNELQQPVPTDFVQRPLPGIYDEIDMEANGYASPDFARELQFPSNPYEKLAGDKKPPSPPPPRFDRFDDDKNHYIDLRPNDTHDYNEIIA